MTHTERQSPPRTGIVESWRSFWFKPELTYPIGLVRIAFGAVVVGLAASIFPDLYSYFGRAGAVTEQPRIPFGWGLFEFFGSDRALLVGWLVLCASALALMVGWHSRLAAILVFVLLLSFERRDPYVFNSGDYLIRIEAFLIALSPCGSALSLDQRRTHRSFWSAQFRPRWPIRLVQLQLSIVYLGAVLPKLQGQMWPNGTAVYYVLRLDEYLVIPAPSFIIENPLLINIATWATLALELSLAILVWNRRCRPWVLAAGVVMHTIMMAGLAVAFFSFAMFVMYLAFVPPRVVEVFIEKAERYATRFSRRGRPPTRDRLSVSSNEESSMVLDVIDPLDAKLLETSTNNGQSPAGGPPFKPRQRI